MLLLKIQNLLHVLIELFIESLELIVGFGSHTVKLKYLSSTGSVVTFIENWLGWFLFNDWHLLDDFLAFSVVFCSFDIAARELVTPGVSQFDRAKVTHYRVFEVRSISGC